MDLLFLLIVILTDEQTPKDILQLPIEQRAEIAFKIAVAKAIDENVRLGILVYVSRNGKVVKLSAREARNSSKPKLKK
jgi:hypothetical protein